MATGKVQALLSALANAEDYPANNCGIEALQHSLSTLQEEFGKRSTKLFGPESSAEVDFLEVEQEDDGFHQPDALRDAVGLEGHLRESWVERRRPDHKQRFIFIRAPSSMAPLKITRLMLHQILTYHQVAPTFLEFILPFGQQEDAEDLFFSGFRSEAFREKPCEPLLIDELRRSGRQIEMSYNLKSVERAKGGVNWSIRPCSVHHKFDLDHGRSLWLVVKANKVMHSAVQQHLDATYGRYGSERSGVSGSKPSAFAASLLVHRIICNKLVGDGWHWYVNDLEAELQRDTRRALYNPQHDRRPPKQSRDLVPDAPERNTTGLTQPRRTTMQTVRDFGRSVQRKSLLVARRDRRVLQDEESIDLGTSHKPIQSIIVAPDEYDLRDSQKVGLFEEKISRALLILRGNSKVLQAIRQEYASLAEDGLDDSPLCGFKSELRDFQRHIGALDQDIGMLVSRLERLVGVAANRKSVVQESIQDRYTQATQILAVKAQETAERMELMTQQMHRLTEKTAFETISMRIITVVTLIFLPGTFVSTLMSTPIVSFDGSPTPKAFSLDNIGWGALEMYLAISLPLLVVTVVGFWTWFLRESRKQAKMLQQSWEPHRKDV